MNDHCVAKESIRIGELAATVFSPEQPKAVTVVLPGFSDGRKHPFTANLCGYLAARGIATIGFDPRGLWESIDPEVGREEPAKHTQSNFQQDIDAVVRYAHRRHQGLPLALGGFCYGGYSAAHYAARNQSVDYLFAVSPTRDSIWGGEYLVEKDTSWRERGMREFEFVDRVNKRLGVFRTKFTRILPYSLVEDERHHNLGVILPYIQQPTLFIAATKDQVIPRETVEESFASCGAKDKQYVLLPIKHDFFDSRRQTRRVNDAVFRFIAAKSNISAGC
ncbi:MAG: alpha/beta fold hydrolase [Patescibacteria group bacterium]